MNEVPQGVIVGGWSFAIAAYTVTALVLSCYAWSLVLRFRKANQKGETS